MEKINIPASIQNLDQMNKLQHKEQDDPVNYSLQNSEIHQDKEEQKAKQANEADEAEGENVDADDRKKQEYEEQQKKRREAKRAISRQNRGRDSGKFVDFSA